MSQKMLIPAREVECESDWDVVVVGGGPAGCAAAIAAARLKARVLLIERTCALGGMGTLGLVPAWCPFSDQKNFIYSGIAREVFDRSKATTPHVPEAKMDWVPIDAEALKRIYDDLVTESGVTILFDSMVADVIKDGQDAIKAIVVASKSGITAYGAKVFIDCTGDGDLAAWAGAAFEKGEPGTGDLMPATHCFTLANVDTYAFEHVQSLRFGKGKPIIDDILASGKYPGIPDAHACNNLVGPGVVGFNTGHMWKVDNTDPKSVSRAAVAGRKMVATYLRAFKEFMPITYGNAWIAQTGALLGIRETRRIIGDYQLTLRDYLERRTFADDICRNAYFIDVHHSQLEAIGNTSNDPRFEERSMRYAPGESHGVPYRCLTPKGLRNVLMAGRCISSDRPVNGSVRVMPVCLSTGEAAGIAAAMVAPKGGDVHAAPVDQVQQRLRSQGAYLP